MFKGSKKGALELSITAIVVLIIAITLLGLAIFFIKNLFAGGTEIFVGELSKIKETLKQNMAESGELVVFSKGTELEVKRGEKMDFHIGVRNSAGTPKCYRIAIFCNRPFKPEGVCTDMVPTGALVGGKDVYENPPVENWFPRMLAEFDVRAGDIEISPITLQIATATPDTYLMELQVFEGGWDEASLSCQSWTDSPWQTKRFHIILR